MKESRAVVRIIDFLGEVRPRRLFLIIVGTAIGITELIGAILSECFFGCVKCDYLVSGFIASLLVSVLISFFLVSMLVRINALRQEVQRMAITDELTGSYNRRMFGEMIHKEIARSKRFAHPLTLVVFDIDNYKQVNDMYGHQVGDKLLKHLADLVRPILRETDTFFRSGGDEFVILAPDTDAGGGKLLAERIRAAIEAMRVNGIPPVTVSLGVEELKTDISGEELVKRADEAMYRAKAEGRNRVAGNA
jgi:diguanylate cyclase (GGDEF)-like protein